MRARAILGGIFLAGAVVSTASAAMGVRSKKIKNEKFIKKMKPELTAKTVANINSVYYNTLESLSLKSRYEKVNIQVLTGLKNAISRNDENIIKLTKTAK